MQYSDFAPYPDKQEDTKPTLEQAQEMVRKYFKKFSWAILLPMSVPKAAEIQDHLRNLEGVVFRQIFWRKEAAFLVENADFSDLANIADECCPRGNLHNYTNPTNRLRFQDETAESAYSLDVMGTMVHFRFV